jgi:hypothetical protein
MGFVVKMRSMVEMLKLLRTAVNLQKVGFGVILTYGAEPFLRSRPIVQPFKNFPAFYGTRRFITIFTTKPILTTDPQTETWP